MLVHVVSLALVVLAQVLQQQQAQRLCTVVAEPSSLPVPEVTANPESRKNTLGVGVCVWDSSQDQSSRLADATRRVMTQHDATGQDTPDMTWHHVLTTNRNRSPISNARNPHAACESQWRPHPNAHRAISNARRQHALSPNRNRKARRGPRRPRRANPPRVQITTHGSQSDNDARTLP